MPRNNSQHSRSHGIGKGDNSNEETVRKTRKRKLKSPEREIALPTKSKQTWLGKPNNKTVN